MTRIGRTTFRMKAALAMALAAMAAMSGAAQAQESGLIGTWDVTTAIPAMPTAPTFNMTWTFASGEDGALTGSWTGEAEGESRSADMSDISVDGDAFDFSVNVTEQGQTVVLSFEGTTAGDEISGTFEMGMEGVPAMVSGTFSGARAEAHAS
ncbi:hypothetical protein [Candidatus Palauibacter sp.]|uniref:hypothetical protein n=1 Tax=Candidatus Palauibacter sp. TaxID=3101350 RepID=UPI003B52AE0F